MLVALLEHFLQHLVLCSKHRILCLEHTVRIVVYACSMENECSKHCLSNARKKKNQKERDEQEAYIYYYT
jgi:hypothetical protein